MAGGGDNRGGTGALELGLMNALRTGNRNVDLFVVAFLPTLIALVATSSERLRDVIRSAAGTGLRRKKRFERIVRVERRPTRWGRGSKIEPEAKNEVLQQAIAWHLVRCGALDGADDAKLRLLARGASEKGAGRHRWNKSFGTTSALLRQYDVVSAVPDDVWVSVPGAPGDLKVMRAVDDGQEDKEEGKDNSTTSIDFRLACDELAPIEAFLETAFDAYVEQTAKEEAGGRHLYVRAGGGGGAKDDDSDDGSGAATYKRYRLAASKTFDSLFFPEKDELLSLLDAFHAGTGRFAVKGSPKKLGVLLHGPPGTGKTSLIKALAARLDRSIVSIPLGRIKTNQEHFDAVFDMKYGVADAAGNESMARHAEVRLAARVELMGWLLLSLRASERARTGPAIESADWTDRSEAVGEFEGKSLGGGMARLCAERFGDAPQDACLLSALLALAPGMTQVGAGLSDSLVPSPAARPQQTGAPLGGAGPCYMLRGDGPLLQVITAPGED